MSSPGVENILDRQLEFRDNLLQQAETAFLEKWSKDLKTQMLKWCSNLTKLKIKPLVLNFDTFIEQATLVEIMARIGEGNDTIEFEEEIDPFEMKFDEAIAYALNKKPTLFSEIDEINDKVKNNCFWIKRSTELTATEKVLKELQKSLEEGGTFKEFMKGIDSVIDKVGMGTNGWYASNVYRTNMMTFYNSGTYKQQMDNITDKPYLLYDGVADNRQSEICKNLDGKVYKATDPIWNTIYPPNHFGCRSSVVAMSKEEVEAFGLTILSPTKAIKEMDLGNFEGNPYNSYWKKLEKNVKIKERKNGSFLEKIKKELKEKELFPETLAGQKRNNPMTREEANEGRANPNYHLGSGYRINCQTCVVSFEARLRGYDVEALPNIRGSMLEKLSRKTNLAWIDPSTGKNPEYIKEHAANTSKKFFDFMDSIIESEKRYTIEFVWKGRGNSGHIISLDRDENKKLRFYDPQIGKTYGEEEIKLYLKKIKYETTLYGNKLPCGPKILRIDDKSFNEAVVNQILKGSVIK